MVSERVTGSRCVLSDFKLRLYFLRFPELRFGSNMKPGFILPILFVASFEVDFGQSVIFSKKGNKDLWPGQPGRSVDLTINKSDRPENFFGVWPSRIYHS